MMCALQLQHKEEMKMMIESHTALNVAMLYNHRQSLFTLVNLTSQ